jgi:hypothetical protein
MIRTAVEGRWRIVDGRRARAAGVDPASLRADKHLVRDAAGLKRRAVWAEEELGDGWVAAWRLVSSRGLPRVAELRVFPGAWSRGARPLATWAGDYLDRPAVPEGGLSGTLLRRLKLAGAFREALDGLARHRDSLPEVFAEAGPMAGVADPRRRSRLVNDEDLRRLAKAYIATGYSVEAVAREFRLKESTVRGRIRIARERKILGRTGKSGRSGGTLLPAAVGARRKGEPR